MQKTITVNSLPFNSIKTYAVASMFIAANIILPQTVHLFPGAGHIWLPIYLFTLVGAYVFGWRVGIITALASPLINSIFGMPPVEALPSILMKSVLLGVFAGYASEKFRKVSVSKLAIVVLAYQTIGTLGEWAISGSFEYASADFRMGIPGMLLQIFGGLAIIKALTSKTTDRL